MVALTDTQYSNIIQTLLHGFEDCRPNPRVAAILTAEANLGMRVGDILRLRMSDIVQDGGRYRLNMTEEKTGKQRKFTVPGEVYTFLRQYATKHKIPDDALLFPITVRQVQHHLKLVCDYLGYKDISTHSFRKWYATSIYNANGHDIVLVQRLLQHSSPMVTRRYIGVSDEQIEDVREAIDSSAAISGTTSQDAAEALHANGGYYLYLYMSREQAKRIGNEVYAKWQKEKEVYDYVHKAYKSFYDSDEAIDKVIYTGICKQYDTTPEQVISTITRKPKGVGDPISAAVLAICQIIAAIVGIVATTLSVVLTICGACMQSKYEEPEDPDFGTPGFGGEDLSEIENYKESGKSLFGVIAAAALILFGIFKR